MKLNFKESKLVFFEGGQADKFVPKIQDVEKKVQAEKEKTTPESSKTDIVDESKVKDKIEGIEKKIKESPVSDKYKDQIEKSLTTLLDKKEKDLKKVDVKKEEKLNALFDKILIDLDGFKDQPEVKDVYETIEPFFENKDKIKPVINLKTYRRGSGHWKEINANLEKKAGIKKEQIDSIQKILKVKKDGKVGPETINALAAMLDEKVSVKFDDKETFYEGENKSVEQKQSELGQIPDEDKEETDGKKVETQDNPDVKATEKVPETPAKATAKDPEAPTPAPDKAPEAPAKTVFESINNEILKPMGVNIAMEKFIKAYDKRPEEKRTPLATIEANFRTLQAFSQLNSSTVSVGANYNDQISKALIFFVNGLPKEGESIIGQIVKELEIRAEAENTAKELEGERKKLIPLEKAHEDAAAEYLVALNSHQNSPKGQAGIIEKYASSFKDLIDGMGAMMSINESFIKKDPVFAEQRQRILSETAGDTLNVGVGIVVPKDDQGNLTLVGQKVLVPTSKEQFEEMRENAANAVLFAKRDLYLKTKLPEYRAAFDESQAKITDRADKDSKESLAEAGKEDEKNMDKPEDYKRLKAEVDSYVGSIVQQFDNIQKLSVSNPARASDELVKFRKNIDSNAAILERFKPFFTKQGISSETVIINNAKAETIDPQQIFSDIGKYPALRNTLLAIFDTYMEQSDALAVDLIEKNPMFLEFQDKFAGFFQGQGEPFHKSIITLINQIETAQKNDPDSPNAEMPSETFVKKWIHQGAIDTMIASKGVLSIQIDELMKKVDKNYGYFTGNKYHTPLGKEASDAFLRVTIKLNKAKEYLRELDKVCNAALEMRGRGEGITGALVDTLKVGGKLVLAVAGAVAASFALASTGFTATPAVAFVVTTVVSSFGATVGSGLGEGLIEGDWRTFEAENFLKSWGTGALFCGAGRMVGNVFGVVGAKTAAGISRLSPRLSASTQKYIQRYSEHLIEKSMNASAVAGGGFRHFINEISTETGEELLENSIQKIGEGIAPKYPALGFVLSCIPSGTRVGRAKFIKETGGFSPTKGVTGLVTERGLDMKYDDRASMLDFLEARKAPQEVLTKFMETGIVDGQFGGIEIKIKPTKEPGSARSILIGPRGMALRQKCNLEFDETKGEYVYKSSPEALVKFFEESGFLVESNAEGKTIVKDSTGKALIFGTETSTKTDIKTDTDTKTDTRTEEQKSRNKERNKRRKERQKLREKKIKKIEPVKEEKNLDIKKPNRFKEWANTQLQKISDLKLRERATALVADLGKVTKDSFDTAKATWKKIRADIGKYGDDFVKAIDQKIDELGKKFDKAVGGPISIEESLAKIKDFAKDSSTKASEIFAKKGKNAEKFLAEADALMKGIEKNPDFRKNPELLSFYEKQKLIIESVRELHEFNIKTDALIRDLYPGGIDSDIKQGQVGNCYLLASLKSLKGRAELMRDIIGRTIKQTGPGKWEVTFLGGDASIGSIEVTDAKLAQWNSNGLNIKGSKGDLILELAYASYKSRVKKQGSAGHTMIGDFNYQGEKQLAVEGGFAHRSLADLLGVMGVKHAIGKYDADRLIVKNAAQSAIDLLRGGMKDEIVTANTPGVFNDKKPFYIEGKEFWYKHAYSVVGYDANTNSVTLANPHNSKQHFSVSVDGFLRAFSQVSFVRISQLGKLSQELRSVRSPEIVTEMVRDALNKYTDSELCGLSSQTSSREMIQHFEHVIDQIADPKIRSIVRAELQAKFNREGTPITLKNYGT